MAKNIQTDAEEFFFYFYKYLETVSWKNVDNLKTIVKLFDIKKWTLNSRNMKESFKWKEELDFLQSIIEKTELEQTIKWGGPVYVINGQNVLSLAAFKAHVALWFFNGVFLKDSEGVLENTQAEKTKAMRQWKFTSKEEMDEAMILSYIQEAIRNAKDGKKHIPQKNKPLIIPDALGEALQQDPKLEEAFEKLNLTQKREFAELISTAKRDATKIARLEKIKPMIMAGKGWNDKYRK